MAICTISAVSPFDRLRMSKLTVFQVGSGVDGSLINGLQIIDSCRPRVFHIYTHVLTPSTVMDNLGDISDNHLGLVIASFSGFQGP